ncbi:MAG TPA: GPW/gp25 family protein [Polyangia bacterium]|nr:GPW/gp25 family protein [Polyangia bacterium]
MARPSFLGKGFAYPVKPGPTPLGPVPPSGNLPNPILGPELDEEEKIRQSIWIILTTAPGERPMLADFGCSIHSRVFANLDDASIGRILNDIDEALAAWEPRVDLLSLDATPDDEQPNLLRISIDYLIRSTNSRFNLVYPFYVS